MSRGWQIVIGSVVLVAGLFGFLLLLLYMYVPRLTEDRYDEFVICDEHFDLASGFTAFDYGSRKSADRFFGDRKFFIRADMPGDGPPAIFDEIFDELPPSLRNVFDDLGYSRWLRSHSLTETAVESNSLRGQTVNFAGGAQ